MLIPDARRDLFGGLVDHAGLLASSPPELPDAVTEYRDLRGGRHGWLMGRFVVPVSRLEELAGLLIGTMAAGEAPWSLTAVLDGDPARDAAVAASVHALLDPAAPIDIVQVSPSEMDCDTIEGSVVAASAVQQEVFPMVRLEVRDDTSIAGEIERLGKRLLKPVGVALTASQAPPSATALAAHLRSLDESGLTFAYEAERAPAVTDAVTGHIGAVNLLAAVGTHDPADTIEVLHGTDASGFDVGFGGLHRVGSSRTVRTRSPLLSIASRRPDATIDELLTADLDI